MGWISDNLSEKERGTRMCLEVSKELTEQVRAEGDRDVWKVVYKQDGRLYSPYLDFEYLPGLNEAKGEVDLYGGELEAGALHCFLVEKEARDFASGYRGRRVLKCRAGVGKLVAAGYWCSFQYRSAGYTELYVEEAEYERVMAE